MADDVNIRVNYQDLEDAKDAADDLLQSIQRINGMSINAHSSQWGQIARDINGVTTAVSALVDGLADASRLTSDFADGIGNAFSSMSSLFKTDVMRYATASLTHQFMQSLVGNLSNVTARYDILSTFLPYMQLAGVDATTAQALQDRIDQSIRGLPIGLDEATQRFRRYNMYINDPERAANLVIGAQNAIMAGGSSESARNQAYNMIERMLATGTLTNIRQWQSLMVGLGVSQKYIEQELGLPQGTLLENIRAKTVSVDEFLAALERLGTGATDAAKGLESALDIYKSTLESWLSNIEFAVTRGNEKVLRAFNETLEIVSGKGITDYMKDYRDFLDSLFGGTADYIRNNPERVQQVLDIVTKVLDTLGRFSLSGTFENALDYLQILADIVTSLLGEIPPGELEQFVAFATTLAGPLGSLFTAVSSGAPAMIAVFERFKEFHFDTLVDSIVKNADSMARVIEGFLNMLTDEQLSDIIGFGLVWGKPLAAALTALSGALSTFATIKVIQGMSVLSQLGSLAGGAAGGVGLGALLGGLVLPATIMTGVAMGRDSANYNALAESMGASRYETYAQDLINAVDNGTGFRWGLFSGSGRGNVIQQKEAQLALEQTQIELYHANQRVAAAYKALEADDLKGLSPDERELALIPRRSELEEALRVQGIAQNNYDTYKSAYDYYTLGGEDGILTNGVNALKDFNDQLEETPSLFEKAADAAQDFVDKQAEVFGRANETLKDVIGRNEQEAEKFGEYTTAVDELMTFLTPENASLIMELTSGGVDNLEQIQDVVEKLKDDPDALDPLIDALAELASQTNEANLKFQEMMVTIDLMQTYGLTQGEAMALNVAAGVRAGTEEAVRAAAELVAQMKAQLGTINWSYVNQVRWHDFESQPTTYYQANGGLIYASNGMFIPIGTDTVPAMLTPGEFVMRKQAVDTFGAAFMKSINDLNIGAAFDRLINTKLSNPRGFVNNTYNTRDDHSTHIQNIKTNNPAFAAKRAGRFVRAMA